MNVVLFEKKEVIGSRITFADRRAEHLVKVLRAEIGDKVRVGIIDGNMGTGMVLGIKKKYPFSVDLHIEFAEPPPGSPSIDLILALPRPIMLKRILSQATALGVGAIHLINANRVEKSFWEAGILQPEEYRFHLLQGLEQAVDTRVPGIHIHRRFKPFIEDYFPTLQSNYRYRLLADPGGKRELGEVVNSGQGRVALAVGPEGGWVDYEIDKFEKQHFWGCTIGERILKVDTAVIALHSRTSALLEISEKDHMSTA
ncbi:MAG: 16S rRNA (uracil(1498)-N(3))-methyltransferase [Desulforhopalus sp.]